MLAYLFFTTLKHMKRKSGNGLKWEVQPTHWERDTLLHGLSPFKSNRKNLLQRNGDRKRIVVVKTFIYILHFCSSNSINLYLHIFRQI